MKTIKSNKKALILVPIILGLFVLSGCVKKEAKQGQESMQEEQREEVKKIDTSNWQTYRNEKYGFEVKYPEDWEYDIESGSNEVEPDLIGEIVFEDKKCAINYYAKGRDTKDRPKSCNKIVRIEYHNPDSYFSHDPLHNKQACNIGQIPLLDFKHELPDVIACQRFGIMTNVWHKYMINTETVDFLLLIMYDDMELGLRDYDWQSEVEKNQYYTYDNSKRFDLAVQQEILKSFKLIKE